MLLVVLLVLLLCSLVVIKLSWSRCPIHLLVAHLPGPSFLQRRHPDQSMGMKRPKSKREWRTASNDVWFLVVVWTLGYRQSLLCTLLNSLTLVSTCCHLYLFISSLWNPWPTGRPVGSEPQTTAWRDQVHRCMVSVFADAGEGWEYHVLIYNPKKDLLSSFP